MNGLIVRKAPVLAWFDNYSFFDTFSALCIPPLESASSLQRVGVEPVEPCGAIGTSGGNILFPHHVHYIMCHLHSGNTVKSTHEYSELYSGLLYSGVGVSEVRPIFGSNRSCFG